MSAFAAAVVSKLASLSPIHKDMADNESIISSPGASSSTSSNSNVSFDARSCLSDSALSSSPVDTRIAPFTKTGIRRNEHLAVLLSKTLWKPDSQASRCDIFLCSRKFSIFERRHHCRKCGGVFCADCSTRTTTLLDTSTLPFLNPPRGVAITAFATPEAQVVESRVCDDCWDQIHGTKYSRSVQLLARKMEEADAWESESASTGSNHSSPRTPHTPLEGAPLPLRSPLRRAHTGPRVHTLSSGYSTPLTHSQTLAIAALEADKDKAAPSELDAYPLRHASAICKATGSGRWEPKPMVQVVGYRVPGMKEAYEIELEREEEERRIRKANPVIKDGEFQVRAPKEFEPHSVTAPIRLSMF
ncbi:FYVE-domain-containing protein [Trametopsis cervina]|nr:FYVE-domain-containing protein [Trametopsis cervina]